MPDSDVRSGARTAEKNGVRTDTKSRRRRASRNGLRSGVERADSGIGARARQALFDIVDFLHGGDRGGRRPMCGAGPYPACANGSG